MNWRKRKIVTFIVAIGTMGALYAFVGPRHHGHHHDKHGCHSEQHDSHGEQSRGATPDNSKTLEVE